MSEAPMKIWVPPTDSRGYVTCGPLAGAPYIEYIRADIVREMLRGAMKDKDYEC